MKKKISKIITLYVNQRGDLREHAFGFIHPQGRTICVPFPRRRGSVTPILTYRNDELKRLSGAALVAVLKKHIKTGDIDQNILERLQIEKG